MAFKAPGSEDLATELVRNLVESNVRAYALSFDFIGKVIDSMRLAGEASVSHQWADRARLHDNGFAKLVLVNSDEWTDESLEGCRLVLHVWDDSTASAFYENIHNHRWPFWSMVLCGQLAWEHYCVTTEPGAGLPYLEYTYTSPGVNLKYEMIPSRCVLLEQRFGAIVGPGTSMAMGHRELHRVRRIGTQPAATVVLQGKPARAGTSVYTSSENLDPVKVSSRFISRDIKPLPVDTTAALLARVGASRAALRGERV